MSQTPLTGTWEARQYGSGEWSVHWVHEGGHTEVCRVDFQDESPDVSNEQLASRIVVAVNAYGELLAACKAMYLARLLGHGQPLAERLGLEWRGIASLGKAITEMAESAIAKTERQNNSATDLANAIRPS